MSIYSKVTNAFKACGGKRVSDNRGFTLIELMAVLVIVGVMMGAFFSGAAIYMKQKRIEDMQVRFDDVRVGLSKFIMDDPNVDLAQGDEVRYPCPASLTAVPGDANYGQEICPSGPIAAGTDLGGVFVVNGSTAGELVLVGAIPTNTLDISDDLMQDEFDNRLTYAVTYGLTTSNALLARPVVPGQVTILDEDGDIKTASAEFMIISHGSDGAGSYTMNGVPNGNDCRTTTTPGDGDSQNCLWQTANTAIFRDQSTYGLSLADNDKAFDDLAVYTLGEDNGWWQATGGAGSDIVNRNPANIGIGPGVTAPVQRLDIDGAIKVANTSNECTSASAGSIRYNNGSKDVVECCNGFDWQDIAFGCSSGVCNGQTIGQMRPNPVTGIPEYCNGSQFVPTTGADCAANHHGQVWPQAETETAECDGGLRGTMTRTRNNEMLCTNGVVQKQKDGTWSEFDRSACAAFPVGQPFSVTCTSKAGRTQTISAVGAGEAAVGTAPSGAGVWVVYENGPYLNCFTERDRYWNGSTSHLDFFDAEGCKKYAHLTGIGRDLASCSFQ